MWHVYRIRIFPNISVDNLTLSLLEYISFSGSSSEFRWPSGAGRMAAGRRSITIKIKEIHAACVVRCCSVLGARYFWNFSLHVTLQQNLVTYFETFRRFHFMINFFNFHSLVRNKDLLLTAFKPICLFFRVLEAPPDTFINVWCFVKIISILFPFLFLRNRSFNSSISI